MLHYFDICMKIHYIKDNGRSKSSKVMAHYVIFTKVVTLTLTFIRFWKQQNWMVLEQSTSAVKKSRRSVQWCGLYVATDRQTDRQTAAVTNILCENRRFHKLINAIILHHIHAPINTIKYIILNPMHWTPGIYIVRYCDRLYLYIISNWTGAHVSGY